MVNSEGVFFYFFADMASKTRAGAWIAPASSSSKVEARTNFSTVDNERNFSRSVVASFYKVFLNLCHPHDFIFVGSRW